MTMEQELPLHEVIPLNQRKMEEYENLIDQILCNMFVSQSELRLQNLELL
jgi:hypothetical protein